MYENVVGGGLFTINHFLYYVPRGTFTLLKEVYTKMIKLPNWIFTNSQPTIYDSESVTAIEMVAKIYGKMNELVEEYNGFVDTTNKTINEFMDQVTTDNEEFRVALRQEFQDFIDVINLKMLDIEADINKFYKECEKHFNEQDLEIANAVNYMKNNIEGVTQAIVESALENETITANLNYNADTKALTLNIGGVE